MNIERFSNTEIRNSLSTSANGTIDSDKPLTYTQWLQYSSIDSINLNEVLTHYTKYVTSWYENRKQISSTNATAVRDRYINLLKEVVSYSTPAEQRYLQNIDYTSSRDLDIALPFFAKKLKDITKYFINQRHDLKFSKIRASINGSDAGIEKSIYNQICLNYTTSDIIKVGLTNIPALTSIADILNIKVQPLYDINQGYFNIDPLSSNSYGVIGINGQYVVDTQTIISNLITEYGSVSSIPTSSFNNYFPDKTDLDIYTYINHYQKYIGTTQIILSTGSTVASIVSGNPKTVSVAGDPFVIHPQYPYANILNREYPTIVTTVDLAQLKDATTIGGYFLPHKLGLTFYVSINPVPVLQVSLLTPNTVYVFPDIDTYGSKKSPFTHIEDVSWAKYNISHGSLWGYPNDSIAFQRFYPYQTQQETLNYQPYGISRQVDSREFWTGFKKNVWSNTDLFPVRPDNKLPISDRIETLNITNKTLYQWKTDIYGNEYGLFKTVKATQPFEYNPNNNIKCLVIDGGNLTTTKYNYGLDAEGFEDNIISDAVDLGDGFSEIPITNNGYFRPDDFCPMNGSTYSLADIPVLESDGHGFDIEFTSNPSILSADKNIFDSRYNTYGELWFRNQYSSVISPATSLSAIGYLFEKYEPSVRNELINNLKNFDMIYDIAIFETDHYVVIDRINSNEGVITGSLNNVIIPLNETAGLDANLGRFEKYCGSWFHEQDNTIIFCKVQCMDGWWDITTPIYPVFYRLNINAPQFLERIYPYPSVYDDPSLEYLFSYYTTTLPTTAIVIDQIDNPLLSFNPDTNLYNVTYMAKDALNKTYLVTYDYKKMGKRVELYNANMFIPEPEKYLDVYFNNTILPLELYYGLGSNTPFYVPYLDGTRVYLLTGNSTFTPGQVNGCSYILYPNMLPNSGTHSFEMQYNANVPGDTGTVLPGFTMFLYTPDVLAVSSDTIDLGNASEVGYGDVLTRGLLGISVKYTSVAGDVTQNIAIKSSAPNGYATLYESTSSYDQYSSHIFALSTNNGNYSLLFDGDLVRTGTTSWSTISSYSVGIVATSGPELNETINFAVESLRVK